MENNNPDNISNEIVEKTKQILKAQELLDIVQSERYSHDHKSAELAEDIRKQKSIISRMKLEKEILEREFWKCKNN